MKLEFENLTEEQVNLIQELIVETSEASAEKALKKFRENEEKNIDRRLHNTNLLLKNYNLFKLSIEEIKYNDEDNTLKELEKIDIEEDSNFLKSILKTKKRTKIMLNYIDSRLNLYKLKCESSGREDIERRYKVLNHLYIETKDDGTNYTTEDVAEMLYVSPGMVSKTKNIALKEIAILLFGISAVKIE